MQLSVASAAALLLLFALCGAAQARPDGSSSGEASSDVSSTPAPKDPASHEGDDNSSSSEEEDVILVEGKVPELCPERQPEILAIESVCSQEEHVACTSTPAPTSEAAATTEEAATTTTSTEGAPAGSTTTDPTPTTSLGRWPRPGTPIPPRNRRKRSCNYHLCVLKKLELLDSSDMPDKVLLTNWITNNVTDEMQKEKLQNRFNECVPTLKDFFGESTENTKSNEEDTTDDKKNEETQSKKKSCVAAKKVLTCLSKSVQCPVIKY